MDINLQVGKPMASSVYIPNQERLEIREQPLRQGDDRVSVMVRQAYYARLSKENRSLLQQLKGINDELSQRIERQRVRKEPLQQPVVKDEKYHMTQKELANAYKQIDILRAKIGSLEVKAKVDESDINLNAAANKLSELTGEAQRLEEQIKLQAKSNKEHAKALQLISGPKILEEVIATRRAEINALKARLREINKELQSREDCSLVQCQVNLEKQLRAAASKQPAKEEVDEVTDELWDAVISEKKLVEEANVAAIKRQEGVKAQLLRLKNSILSKREQNALKDKDIQKLKSKVNELKKLIKKPARANEPETQTPAAIPVQEMEEEPVHKPEEHDKSKGLGSKPNGQRLQRLSRFQEQGSLRPDSLYFTDKRELLKVVRPRIVGLRVYLSGEYPACLQAVYKHDSGVLAPSLNEVAAKLCQNLPFKEVELEKDDYLVRVGGSLDRSGFLQNIEVESKAGRVEQLGKQGEQDSVAFKFKTGQNYLPGCLFGAVLPVGKGHRMCYLGCEMVQS